MKMSTFMYREATNVLEDGEYEVSLTDVREVNANGYNFLRFSFMLNGDTDIAPNNFSLFDVQNIGDRKEVDAFEKRASAIFRCFDLHGSFTAQNMVSWLGKTGKIVVGKDAKGFAVVKKLIARENYIPDSAVQNTMPIY